MRLYIRFLGLFCCFCLFSNLLSAQIRCARLANIGEGFPSDFVLGDKELSIRVMDKRSHSDIPFRKIDSIFITTLGKKIALTPMNADHIANYDYTDVVGDSAIIDIYSSEYGHGRYVYYKSIHRAPHFYSSITLYLSKEDYCPNELIVVGDRIELNLGKEKIGYDMGKLRQSKKEKWISLDKCYWGLTISMWDLMSLGRLNWRVNFSREEELNLCV